MQIRFSDVCLQGEVCVSVPGGNEMHLHPRGCSKRPRAKTESAGTVALKSYRIKMFAKENHGLPKK